MKKLMIMLRKWWRNTVSWVKQPALAQCMKANVDNTVDKTNIAINYDPATTCYITISIKTS